MSSDSTLPIYTVLVTVLRHNEPTNLKEVAEYLTLARAADVYAAAVEAARAEIMSAAPHVSDLYTPLFDNERGGPPRAFRCEQCFNDNAMTHNCADGFCITCARVTRTESGMLMHLRICHGIERQPRLFK